MGSTSKLLQDLPLQGIMQPLVTNTKLSSLRKLFLSDVSLKEEMFQDLISKSPIENIAPPKGVTLKKIRVFCLCNHKYMRIFAWKELEELDIYIYQVYDTCKNSIYIKFIKTWYMQKFSS